MRNDNQGEQPPNKLSPKQLKLLTAFCWVFLIISIAGILWQAPNILYRHYNPATPQEVSSLVSQKTGKDPYSITKHVRMNGTDYDIPVGYFAVMVPSYTQDTEIYLLVFRPDFTILPGSEMDVFNHGKEGRVLRILAHDPAGYKTPAQIAPSSMGLTGRSIPTGKKVFNLDTYDFTSGVLHGKNGEPFTHSEEGDIKTLLDCHEYDPTSPSRGDPTCQHYFSDGYLIYDTWYSRKDMKDWKEIEDKTKALFAGFREKAKEEHLDKAQIPPDRISPTVFTQVNPNQISK